MAGKGVAAPAGGVLVKMQAKMASSPFAESVNSY
jgi:hypothetical protein